MSQNVSGLSSKSYALPAESAEQRGGFGQAAAMNKRIMVVVPGRLFRDGICHVLRRPDRVLAETFESLDEVEAAMGYLEAPDLFVVGFTDVEQTAQMFAQIRRLRAKMSTARWIVLSRRTGLEFLREAVATGIDGMLLEDSSGEVLQLVAELVFLGHSLVPSELARILADATIASALPAAAESSPGLIHDLTAVPPKSDVIRVDPVAPVVADMPQRRAVSLSERENEILQCLVAGHSNKLVARELGIAEATVKVHVKGLLRKMQVSNRTQAAISALNFQNAAGRPNSSNRVVSLPSGASRPTVTLRAVDAAEDWRAANG